MKVAIFGATGGTGRIMVRKALERGHEITAAVRNPSALSGSYERLRVVKADVMQNQQTLEAVVEGQDAVITSISIGNPLKEGRKPTTLFSEGTRNVIAAMKRQGVRRLVCLSPARSNRTQRSGSSSARLEAAAIQGNVRGHEPDGARGQRDQLRLEHCAPLDSDR